MTRKEYYTALRACGLSPLEAWVVIKRVERYLGAPLDLIVGIRAITRSP